MNIKSTKNIIREIEGTNTFEVLTFGKGKDLDELKDKLAMNGFEFKEDGSISNLEKRAKALEKYANNANPIVKKSVQSNVRGIIRDAYKYSSYFNEEKKNYMFKYILDMNNIEVVLDKDYNGNSIGKIAIDLKTSDDDNLLSWAEVNNNNDENVITISDYRYYDNNSYGIKNANDLDDKIVIYTDINNTTSKIDTGMNVMLKGKDSIYTVIAIYRTANDKLKLILIDNNLKGVNRMKNDERVCMGTQGESVGRTLKSIFENIKTEKLREVGIDVKNDDGSFKTMEEVLSEISELKDEDIMKSSRILVGEYNSNHLFALVNNFKNN